MRSFSPANLARAALIAVIFASGYVCGALGTTRADAQLGSMATEALRGAVSGTTIGEMGTALVEAEQHVSGLQKNIDTLNKVKAALGG